MDIFISHSSKDALIAKQMVELIRSAYNISSRNIRCTSIVSTQLPSGVSINDTLRKDIESSSVLIAILTRESLSSLYTMFELGARWMSGKTLIPVVKRSDADYVLREPLKSLNAIVVRTTDDVFKLIDDLDPHLMNYDLEPVSSYSTKVNELYSVMICDSHQEKRKNEVSQQPSLRSFYDKIEEEIAQSAKDS